MLLALSTANECTCPNGTPTVATPVAGACTFQSGRASGGTEKALGAAASDAECEALVRTKESTANGATRAHPNGWNCWAEFGATSIQSDSGYRACIFPTPPGGAGCISDDYQLACSGGKCKCADCVLLLLLLLLLRCCCYFDSCFCFQRKMTSVEVKRPLSRPPCMGVYIYCIPSPLPWTTLRHARLASNAKVATAAAVVVIVTTAAAAAAVVVAIVTTAAAVVVLWPL